jgi:hypothetical protein
MTSDCEKPPTFFGRHDRTSRGRPRLPKSAVPNRAVRKAESPSQVRGTAAPVRPARRRRASRQNLKTKLAPNAIYILMHEVIDVNRVSRGRRRLKLLEKVQIPIPRLSFRKAHRHSRRWAFCLQSRCVSSGKPSSSGVIFSQGCRSKFAASRFPASDSRGSKSGRPDDLGNRYRYNQPCFKGIATMTGFLAETDCQRNDSNPYDVT